MAVQIPAELMRSSPRPVRLTGGGRAVATLALALAAGAAFSGPWLYALAEDSAERRREAAVSTTAEVVRVDRERFTYSYAAAGRVYQGRARYRRRSPPGNGVVVHYRPSDPARSWLAGREPQGLPFWLVPVAPAGLALAALALGFALRRQRALLSEGYAALARVTEARRVRTGTHSGSGYRVDYEFRTLSGASRSGHFDDSKKPPPGSLLIILYDPDQPRRQARYPLSLVRIDAT